MTVEFHDEHMSDRVAMLAMRGLLQLSGAPELGPEGRPGFDEMMVRTPPADAIEYEGGEVGGVPGWWCRPSDSGRTGVILYVHGGGYVMGSATAFRHYVGHLAARSGLSAFIPDYALAPERPFPRALDDIIAVYRALVDDGHEQIRLAGDSAGGGLTLVSLAAIVRDPSLPDPAGAAVVSALTDMAMTGASMETRSKYDPLVSREVLEPAANCYLGDGDRRQIDASPLYGDLSGLPPVLLHVGHDEVLLDDTVRYAEKMNKAGGSAVAHVWKGMPHVFTANLGQFKAAHEAVDSIAAFLAEPEHRSSAST